MLIEKYLSGSYCYLITFKEDKTSYLNLASSLLNSKKGIGGDYLLVVNKETKEIEMYNDKEKEKNYIPSSLFVVHSFLKRHNLIEEPFYKISYNNKTYPLHCLETRAVIPLGVASLIKELISIDEIEIQGHKIKFSSLFLNEPLLVFYEDDIYSSFVFNILYARSFMLLEILKLLLSLNAFNSAQVISCTCEVTLLSFSQIKLSASCLA